MRKTLHLGLILIFLCFFPLFSSAQDTLSNSLFNLLNTLEPLELRLELDFDSLEIIKRTNTYLPATLAYKISKKDWEEWPLQVRARGKFRRIKCDFPPLKLNFSEKKLKNAGFKPYDEFKLVTHCLQNKAGREVVLREYLIYKLYQVLTDYSFRVILADITYKNNQSKNKDRNYGILIEPQKELEKRLKCDTCEDCYSVPPDSLQQEIAHINGLFQYMIANTDWSVEKLRNINLMKMDSQNLYLPIPYDFDFCGLVSAPYAYPQPDFQLEHIRDRIYLGSAKEDAELQDTIDYFKSKKAALLNTVHAFDLLSKSSRNDIAGFIESFFDSIEQEGLTRWNP